MEDNWIKWGGAACPVKKGTLVDVTHGDGEIFLHVKAGSDEARDWSKDDTHNVSDIVAYRLSTTV